MQKPVANKIAPVVGYVVINAFIEYFHSVSPEELSDDLAPEGHAFSKNCVLECGLNHAVSSWCMDLEDVAGALKQLDWMLPKKTRRRPWFKLLDEGGGQRDLVRHADEIEALWAKTCAANSKSACHLLFNDVPTLFEFNKKLADGNKTRRIKTPRKTIPNWVKEPVYHRDGGHCHWCERSVGAYNAQTQFDHMIPLAAFGINDVSNIVLSCGKCNRKKSSTARRVKKEKFRW